MKKAELTIDLSIDTPSLVDSRYVERCTDGSPISLAKMMETREWCREGGTRCGRPTPNPEHIASSRPVLSDPIPGRIDQISHVDQEWSGVVDGEVIEPRVPDDRHSYLREGPRERGLLDKRILLKEDAVEVE